MVSGSTIIVIAGALIIFFAVGGLAGIKTFSLGLGGRVSGLIPSLQTATASTGSEQEAIAADQAQQPPAALAVTQTRKNGNQLQTIIRVSEFQPVLQQEIARSATGGGDIIRGGTLLLDKPTTSLISQLTGKGTAQFSTGQVGLLTEAKRTEIARRELTTQEIRDIAALDARRTAAIDRGIQPNVKLSGAELVLRKREQEELSKSLLTSQFGGQTFVGGKLFANPLFETGGKAV